MIEFIHQRDRENPICPFPYGGVPTDFTMIALRNGVYYGHISWQWQTSGTVMSLYADEIQPVAHAEIITALIAAAHEYAAEHDGVAAPIVPESGYISPTAEEAEAVIEEIAMIEALTALDEGDDA